MVPMVAGWIPSLSRARIDLGRNGHWQQDGMGSSKAAACGVGGRAVMFPVLLYPFFIHVSGNLISSGYTIILWYTYNETTIEMFGLGRVSHVIISEMAIGKVLAEHTLCLAGAAPVPG